MARSLGQDLTTSLYPIKYDDQLYLSYLGDAEEPIMEVRSCPVNLLRLCVTSHAEQNKCDKMRVGACLPGCAWLEQSYQRLPLQLG